MEPGPKLDEYLNLCQAHPSWGRHRPSEAEIQQAIASLSNPHSVSYITFETILSLEKAPYFAHLPLLLAGAHVLPSCVRLLKEYCNDQVHLFEYAYGYLCLQVMNLSIEVAKLARVNDLSEFIRFVERSSKGAHGKIITEDLSVRIRKWESQEFAPRGEFLRPANKLLGWQVDPSTGLAISLPQIGGFTILATVFLMIKIWEDRGNFLKCLRSALHLESYAGWCGVIHLMHNTLVQMHGMSLVNDQGFDEDPNWMTLVDIMHRYALCARPYEEPTLSYLIKDRPDHKRERHRVTALDEVDVSQIVEAYIEKAHQHPTIIYAHATRLFGFTMTNCYLDESEFVTNIGRITEAAFDDAWAQFGKMGGVGLSVWTYFTDSVINTLVLVPAFSKFVDQRPAVLEVIVNENLFDFLGYFILYPLTTNDGVIIENRWYWQRNTLQVLYRFIPLLKEHAERASIELISSLYSTWNKTALSLQYHKVMARSNSAHTKDYIYTWEATWSQIWEAIDWYPSDYVWLVGIVVVDANKSIGMSVLILID